jgi:Acyl-CoA reductase (LuxC)
LKETYKAQISARLGRGVTVHIAPANVPVNFAYSLVCGLLAGNACIVRAPSKPFAQTGIICRAMQQVFDTEPSHPLRNYIAIVRYDRDDEITAYFSGLCDVRIIWGGDDAIQEIRKIPIPARAFDLTFADRYSICVIHAAACLVQPDFTKIARDFYNDTYLYDQNACSSPRLVVWIGTEEKIRAAKEKFWTAVHDVVQERYTMAAIIAVDKLTTLCRCALDLPGAKAAAMPDHLIDRIQLEELSPDLDQYRCAGGSFFEYDDQNLDALRPIVTRKYQTLSYIGFDPEDLRQWVLSNGLAGIDRVVPIGRTADFGPIWDGYDLISFLSRVCDAK